MAKRDIQTLLVFSLLTLLLYIIARVPLNQPLKDLGSSWVFVLVPLVLYMLVNPANGVYLGIVSSVFLLNLILISLLAVYTTEIKSILQALIFFKVPAEFAFILTISLRFLPIVQDELNKIRIAQAVRGYEPAPFSPPFPLMVPLLHSSLKRAMELAISLESRGFDPENIHVAIDLKLRAVDYLLLLLLPLFVFLIF